MTDERKKDALLYMAIRELDNLADYIDDYGEDRRPQIDTIIDLGMEALGVDSLEPETLSADEGRK